MATAQQVKRYGTHQRLLVRNAQRTLQAWLSRNPNPSQSDVIAVMINLSERFGAAAAEVAAGFFAELRDASVATGRFVATPSLDSDRDRIARETIFALKQPDSLALLGGALDVAVQQYGRDTITSNADRDGARWARVPQGKTCAFCLMLASRGAEYLTEESAQLKSMGGKYHDKCDCQPVAVWAGDDLPYDAGKLYGIYSAARDANGDNWFDTKGILSELRAIANVTDAHVRP